MLKKNQTKDGFAQSIEFDTSEGAKELYVFLRAPENISLEQSLHLIWDNYKIYYKYMNYSQCSQFIPEYF